jgi:acetyl-CoA synthetase
VTEGSLVLPAHLKGSWLNAESYQAWTEKSHSDPEGFWAEQAKIISWYSVWSKVKDVRFQSPVSIRWFEGGKLNPTFSCVDRHLEHDADRVAYYWEPDSPDDQRRIITYQDLYEGMCRTAQILKKYGVKKGDRVTISMPMIPEAVFAILACARIGAVHSVVFGGFSAEAVADRIEDCASDFVITADFGRRGGKRIPLKSTIDQALTKTSRVKMVFVFRHVGEPVDWVEGRDLWMHENWDQVPANCSPEVMDAEDPLFILYTSGSTNKPKGVLHTVGGYSVYAAFTHKYVFDYHEGDVYWCTADVGWITGHTYIVYGPLANKATSVLFEGVPSYPSFSRFWEVVDRYSVSTFYTAPTALRALMREGEAPLANTSRRSLRLLGSVGEPINPEVWLWYHREVGKGRCPVIDTWWQTETGGVLMCPLPGVTPLKPGSATKSLFGVKPVLMSAEGQVIEGAGEGNLCLADSWPGQMRTVYGDHERFEQTYFSTYPGYYFTGDGCRRDADGDHWITGRVDDVINVSGHRLGTAEIESALVKNPQVAEAAVVGYPHDLKGQGIYCYVTLKAEVEPTDLLASELKQWVRQEIGPIATPDVIRWAPELPKTRSGKIMRRILRKIAEGQLDSLGDTSTLANPDWGRSLT